VLVKVSSNAFAEGAWLLGGPLVLAFYPADWSPVCGDQLVLYNELLQDLRQHNASVAGWPVMPSRLLQGSQAALPAALGFWAQRRVARSYGSSRTTRSAFDPAF